MLIDWFTVGAQIVNFLVLMGLLKIFLYDRVIQAMDAREQKITARLDDAERKQREADDDRKKVKEEQQSLDAKRDKMLSDAREAARSKRKELEDQARSEVDALKDRWRDALRDQRERFARDLGNKAVQHAMAVAQRVVEDMAGEDFQDRLIETFAARVRNIGDDEKTALVEGLDGETPAATVLSDTSVSTAQRRKITRLLHEELHPDLDVDYRTDGDLLGGIELRVPGRKVSWTPRQYLADLEEDVLQELAAASSREENTDTDHDHHQAAEARHER